MIKKSELEALLQEATIKINKAMSSLSGYDSHANLAELFFERGDIYLAMKQYKSAMSDYETCMDYDPYFYEADSRIDAIIEHVLPLSMK